jgi:hypothetical protein
MKEKMKSESALRREGMELLRNNLGLIDSARFIDIITRDKFDYTEWRRNLGKDKTLYEIYIDAVEFAKKLKEEK